MKPRINLPAEEIEEILRSGIQKTRPRTKSAYDEEKILPMLLGSYYVPKNDPDRNKNIDELTEMMAMGSPKKVPLELLKATYEMMVKRCFEIMDRAGGKITGQKAMNILVDTAETVSTEKTASIAGRLRRLACRI